MALVFVAAGFVVKVDGLAHGGVDVADPKEAEVELYPVVEGDLDFGEFLRLGGEAIDLHNKARSTI